MASGSFDDFGMHILCIDDSASQLALYRDLLEGMYRVSLAETYEEAVACLPATRPDLILLDMNMPKVSGLAFLDILRYTPSYASVPVIIVSGDRDGEHIKEAFRRGAADYVWKPYDGEELELRINRLFQLIAGARRNVRSAMTEEGSGVLAPAQSLLVKSLSDLASARDNANTNHLERIGLYAKALAETAAKNPLFRYTIDGAFIDKIAEMARLHDIGKVNIPEYILEKQDSLTDKEGEHVRSHTTDGARMIDMIRLSFPDYAFLDFARDIVLSHHERWDGTGYPGGLAARAIPLSARIVAIVDTFDAVTINRPYREAVGFDEACAIIAEGKGTAFDPDVADAFRFCNVPFREIYEQKGEGKPR